MKAEQFDLQATAMSRRRLIGRLAAAGFATPVIASILQAEGLAQEATPDPRDILIEIGKDPGLIARGSTTFETPVEMMTEFLTPNDTFFVRSNGPVSMDIDPAEWRLSVTGLVDTPLELALDDLKAMETKTITAFLECSGNSRGRFGSDPAEVEGTKWGNGAIGNAEWTGVSVADVLAQASVQADAVDVVSQGGDFEEMQRGLPLEVALNADVMLVWQMNGQDLPKPNGGPARLLVPGWGGIASTKWVVGLEVIDHPFDGHFNTESYVFIDEEGIVQRPVTTMPVKSVIVSPTPDATVTAGTQTITGFAWSGYAGIESVEVSVDDGETWEAATITEEAGPYSWVRFEYEWNAAAGSAVLKSRATDQRKLQQPSSVPWNGKGYGMNEVYAVPVTVS